MANGFNLTPQAMGLLGAASGLLGASGYSARPISMGEALGQGIQGGISGYTAGVGLQQQQDLMEMRRMQMQAEQAEMQRKLAAQQRLGEMAQQFKSPRELATALTMSGDPSLIQQGLAISKGLPKVKSVQEMMVDGRVAAVPVFETGEFGAPSEQTVAKAMQFQNLGGQTVGVDPFTGQPKAAFAQTMAPGEQARLAQSAQQFGVQQGLAQQRMMLDLQDMQRRAQAEAYKMSPEYLSMAAGAKAAGQQRGASMAQAQSDLPRVMESAVESIGQVDDLLAHPGFERAVGTSSILNPLNYVPGTAGKDFKLRLEQLQAKQFLEGAQSLKGMGALTEAEGQKVQRAISVMDTAQTEKEFTNAANTYKRTVAQYVNRVRSSAGEQGISLGQLEALSTPIRQQVVPTPGALPTPAGLPIPGSNGGGFDDGFGELIVR